MTNGDITILKFVQNSGNMARIESYRQVDMSADTRLALLEEHGYIKKHIHNSDPYYAGDYEITEKGYAFLSDYQNERKRSLTTFLVCNILIPAFIAWLTAFFTVCMNK